MTRAAALLLTVLALAACVQKDADAQFGDQHFKTAAHAAPGLPRAPDQRDALRFGDRCRAAAMSTIFPFFRT